MDNGELIMWAIMIIVGVPILCAVWLIIYAILAFLWGFWSTLLHL